MDAELTRLIARHASAEGPTETALPGFKLMRMERAMPRTPVVYGTSICFVAQGAKLAHVGDTTHVYDAGNYLICSFTLPIESEIRRATRGQPFLGAVLDVDPALVRQLLLEMDDAASVTSRPVAHPVASSPFTEAMARVVARMVAICTDQVDCRVLGPGLTKELVYEVLRGPHGFILRDYVAREGSFARVPRVVRYLEQNFRRSIDVDEIAKHAGMSPSALHKHFKQATTMTPMQYVKRLRLHHARTLILGGSAASEAAFEVGYASPSQFSRDFKRMFGHAPQQLRAAVSA